MRLLPGHVCFWPVATDPDFRSSVANGGIADMPVTIAKRRE
jgi:hypothetical protein